MGLSIYKKRKIEELKEKARIMYKQGLNYREVGKALGKSHTWAWMAVNELSTGQDFTKLDKK